jgi:hypothetical protein
MNGATLRFGKVRIGSERRGTVRNRNQTGINHRCTQMNTDGEKDRHELRAMEERGAKAAKGRAQKTEEGTAN